MQQPDDILEPLRKIERENNAKAEQNRQRFPTIYAEFIEPMQREFGKVRVIHIREGDQEAGNVDTQPWIPWPQFKQHSNTVKTVSTAAKVRK